MNKTCIYLSHRSRSKLLSLESTMTMSMIERDCFQFQWQVKIDKNFGDPRHKPFMKWSGRNKAHGHTH